MRSFSIVSTLFLLFLSTYLSTAQVVTTNPPFPVVNQPVTITFDAAQGSGGLAGYLGDIYAHTGVITENSTSGSDWRYVKEDWGVNIPDCKLTRIGTDLYTLTIQPDITGYYGVSAGEQILKMAFVFRSAVQVGGQWLEGKTETGGDIFVDVYESGLNITFLQPFNFPYITVPDEPFIVEVAATESDSVWLYVDDLLVKKTAGTHLTDTIIPVNYGKYQVTAIAGDLQESVADSFYFHVRKPVTIQEEPADSHTGINYTGPSSAVLSLLAPGKEFIYVIGDFNNWDIDSNYYMKMTPDGESFWLEIDGLVPGKEYIFQYYIDGKIKVGDPFADKTSDPWNDSYISNETYPGLIQYPVGKTTGVATVLQTNQAPYDWQVNDFQPPAVTDLVIYETLVRDFTTGHSYQGVIDSLDYLQKLGINAVELMPVNEFEGNISWGYNPSYYFAPDKYYGPKDKLKELVDECHKRGMAVIIDLVLNHAYDLCPFVQMYFDGDNPTADNPWFNVQSNFENPDAQWGNDFNHESLYTQALVDSINSYWMNEYRVDGFRFDFTKGIGNNIKDKDTDPWGSVYDADRIRLLKRMADQIWARNPDAFVIFEHLAENSEEKELANYGILLWGNMNGKYGEAAMGYNTGSNSELNWISYKIRGWNHPHVVGYMESHDEERLMFKCYQWGNGSGDYSTKDSLTALQRMQLNAAFFLTVPGPKMIWQFGEMGYDVSIDFNGRLGPKPVLWNYLDEPARKYLHDFYAALIALRTQHPAFETNTFNMYTTSATKRIVLTHSEMNVVVLGNFDVVSAQMQVSFPGLGTYYDYFTGDSIVVDVTTETIALQPGGYRIYTSVRLETPQIGTAIPEGPLRRDACQIIVYPNPAGETLHLDVPSSCAGAFSQAGEITLVICDVSGREAARHVMTDSGNGLSVDISALAPGAYFARFTSKGRYLGGARFLKAY